MCMLLPDQNSNVSFNGGGRGWAQDGDVDERFAGLPGQKEKLD